MIIGPLPASSIPQTKPIFSKIYKYGSLLKFLMEPIQIIGIDEISEEERDIVNRLSNEYYSKISRSLKNDISIKLHVKQHSKEGKRHKSDIRVKLNAPTRVFEAQESDWDLARTIHRVFNNIERQIQHRFRD